MTYKPLSLSISTVCSANRLKNLQLRTEYENKSAYSIFDISWYHLHHILKRLHTHLHLEHSKFLEQVYQEKFNSLDVLAVLSASRTENREQLKPIKIKIF